jgi:formylglycine-generating enzyme
MALGCALVTALLAPRCGQDETFDGAGIGGAAGTGASAGGIAGGAGKEGGGAAGVVNGGASGGLSDDAAGPGGTSSEAAAGGLGGQSGSTGNDAGPTPPSCVSLPETCGPGQSGPCCESPLVPGGTYLRSYDGWSTWGKEPNHPATVSGFLLDRYEVTVGRFRRFVEAGMGTQVSPPLPDAGAHPKIPYSGWDPAHKAQLAADTAALRSALHCMPMQETWTDTPGPYENRPINCVSWYTAFAFCAWDGGRLPTEAEWNYAASGGSEQRSFPWSNPPSSQEWDNTYAGLLCPVTSIKPCGVDDILFVGSFSPKGDGKWGHSDLVGNLWEWCLDYFGPYPNPCVDCAALGSGPSGHRVRRGHSFEWSNVTPTSAYRGGLYPEQRGGMFGFRCARDP